MNDMTTDPLYQAVARALRHLPVDKAAELAARRLTALDRRAPARAPSELDAQRR